MTQLIGFLIAIGAYSIYLVIKSLNTNHSDVKGTPVGGEVFPTIKMYTPDEKTYEEYIKIPDTNTTTKTTTRKSYTERKKETKTISPVPSVGTENENISKITLKNRSEAKRAFIHAEIFNRKYN